MMTIQQAIVTLVAAIISGVLATFITICVNKYNENIRIKQALVDEIFGYKYQIMGSEQDKSLDINSKGFTRAMNRIPIVFCRDNKVLDAYDKLYDALSIVAPVEKAIKSEEALIIFMKKLCIAAHIQCENWNDSRFKRTFRV